ncbi:MAG: hypothetical protein AB1916_10410 [Thermodesulfobacteriota bacterium]
MAVTGINGKNADWSKDILDILAKQREAGESEDVAKEAVTSLDRNKDAALNLKESGLSRTAFASADKDGDGKLSARELADALAAERALIAAGLASPDSPDAVAGALIDQIDLVDRMEGIAAKFMSLLDKDGDSGLSIKESGLSKDAFAKADADGDGVISGRELADALIGEHQARIDGGASNAGGESLFDSLLRQAGQAVAMQPRQLRKALQAYGSNILASALSEGDAGSGSLFSTSDILSGGQASLLGLLDTGAGSSAGGNRYATLASLLDSSI